MSVMPLQLEFLLATSAQLCRFFQIEATGSAQRGWSLSFFPKQFLGNWRGFLQAIFCRAYLGPELEGVVCPDGWFGQQSWQSWCRGVPEVLVTQRFLSAWPPGGIQHHHLGQQRQCILARLQHRHPLFNAASAIVDFLVGPCFHGGRSIALWSDLALYPEICTEKDKSHPRQSPV